MARKLFCELGPWAYKISVFKEGVRKDIKDIIKHNKLAKRKAKEDYKYIFDETKRIFSEQGINLTMDEFHKAKTLKRSI